MLDPTLRLNAALEGRYRIERELGQGGMATVYLARDEKHNRRVALKMLKPELAAVVGAERFLAEIETTANLQHPHILPLFDSGEADGFLFYVMPYVEGESLRERLDREHQLAVDEAVQIAKNVAEALDYAHSQGVIHRDIKPANILLQAGKPVVSDFGIALAISAGGGNRITETGLTLGTPHYMSPEQATGDLSVGPAADSYALGCVLYEALVGSFPFAGSTPQAVLGKIVTSEAPSARAERKSVPPNVDAAIRRVLEKVPADRFGSAREFARALDDPGFRHGEGTVSAGAGADSGAGAWKGLAAVFGALVLVSAGVAAWALSRPVPTLPVSRQVVSGAPAATVVPSVAQPDVVITLDGQTVVYQSSVNPYEVAVRPLDGLESVTLQGPEQILGAFVSPDGATLGFMAGAGGPIQRVSTLGGPPQMVAQPLANMRGASWGPDDVIVYGVRDGGGLWQVPAGGGEEPRPLTETDGGIHWFPDHLPNGAGILFASTTEPSVRPEQISVLDLRTGEHRVIIPVGTSPWYASSGHIVYAVGSTLMAVGFDAERLEVTSDPVTVVEGVMVKGSGAASFSLSETGSLVYVRGGIVVGQRTLVWVDRDGTDESPLPLPHRGYTNPRLSPDGTRLAVSVGDRGSLPLWVYDVVSGSELQLTQGGSAYTPIWTLDDRVAFSAQPEEGGGFQVYTARTDGSAPPRLLLPNDIPAGGVQGDYPTAVTPDGRYLIVTRVLTSTHREIGQVPICV